MKTQSPIPYSLWRTLLTVVACFSGPALVSAGWIEAKPEELTMSPPEWCREADAMVLDKATGFLLDLSGGASLTGKHTLRIKVFTAKGVEYGDFMIVESIGQKISQITARTISPDGRESKLKSSQIFKKTVHTGEHNEYRQKVYQFAFPNVQPGSILEVQYSSVTEQIVFIEPYYFDYRGLPTRISVLSFTFPVGVQYRGSVANGAGYNIDQNLEDLLTTEGKKVRYSIGASDMNIDLSKRFAPPDGYARPCFHLVFSKYVAPGYSVDIIPNWAAAAKSAVSHMEDFVRGSKQVQSVGQAVTASATSPEQQARQLFRWVADSIELIDSKYCYDFDGNVNGKVKARKATGAEKVLILKALYDQAGLESVPLLCVPSTEAPGVKLVPTLMQFRRLLLRLLIDGKPYYLDPSEPYACFDLIPAELEYAMALPVSRTADDVTKVPQCTIPNRIDYDFRCSLGPEGDVEGEGTIRMTGEHYIRAYQEVYQADSADRREYVAKRLLRGIHAGDLVGLECSHVSSDSGALELNLRFTARGYGKAVGDEILVIPNCLDAVEPGLLPQDEARNLPVHFNGATHSKAVIRYSLPDGYVCAFDSTGSYEHLRNVLRVTADVVPASDKRTFVYSRSYDRTAEVFVAEEYAELRTCFERIALADQKDIIVRRTQP